MNNNYMNQLIYKDKMAKNSIVGNNYNCYKLPATDYLQKFKLDSINILIHEVSYKWTEKQIIEFLEGLWKFRNSYLVIPSNYCLGSVIIEKNETSLELVTGSEQLITTYIILYVLKQDNFKLQFESKPSIEDSINIRIALKIVKNWLIQKELEITFDVRSGFRKIMEKCTEISFR